MSSWFQAGGPAQYNQACKLSRNLFVDKFNFYLELWDLIGYDYSWTEHRAAAAIAQVTWSCLVHLARLLVAGY